MKKLKFSADEIDEKLGQVAGIKSNANSALSSVAKANKDILDISNNIKLIQGNVSTLDSLATATDLAFKGFIEGSDLNLKTIDTSLTTTKASLEALSGIKEWAGSQIEANKQQYEAALNDHKATIADHYATVAGVKAIETSLDHVSQALGSVDAIMDENQNIIGYEAESIRAVADASLAQAQAVQAYTDTQVAITNQSVGAVQKALGGIEKIADSTAEGFHYQAKGVQAIADAINAEGTGLAALKDAVDVAQDAANTNKTAFETFYKTDENGEVLPGTVFGTFKTMVDEHDAAMKDTETGLTALHTAIGAVKGITDSQATLIEGQSKLITDHKAILDGVQTIANNSKTFLDDHKTAIENCISTTEVGNRINNMHTTVTGEIASAQKTVSDKVTKVGEEVTALGKDVAGIGNKVAEQMQIAFGEIVDPDTGEKRPNQLVVDIKNLADSANDHASNAEIASNAAKAKAEEIKGITDKLTTETLPAITNQVANAKQQTEALKTQVTEDLETLTGNYNTLNTSIGTAQTDLSNIKKDLNGDGTETNPGILKTVEKTQTVISTATSNIEKAQKDIQGLTSDLADKQKKIEEAETRLGTAETTLNGLDGRFNEVNTKIAQAQSKVDGLSTQLTGENGIIQKVTKAEAAITQAKKDITDNKVLFDNNVKEFNEKLNGDGTKENPGILNQISEAKTAIQNADKILNGDKEQDPTDTGLKGKIADAQDKIKVASDQIKSNKEELDKNINDFKLEVNGNPNSQDENTKLGLIGQANKAIEAANSNITQLGTTIKQANGTLNELQTKITKVEGETLPALNKLASDAKTLADQNKLTGETLTQTSEEIRDIAESTETNLGIITGKINSGELSIRTGSITLGGTAAAPNFKVDDQGNVAIKHGEINLGSGKFKVTDTGALTATSGTIAGFTINNDKLSSAAITLDATKLIINDTTNDVISTVGLDGVTLTDHNYLTETGGHLTTYSHDSVKAYDTSLTYGSHCYSINMLRGNYEKGSHLFLYNNKDSGDRHGVLLQAEDPEQNNAVAKLYVGHGTYPNDVYCPTGVFIDRYGSLDSRYLIKTNSSKWNNYVAKTDTNIVKSSQSNLKIKAGIVKVNGHSYTTINVPGKAIAVAVAKDFGTTAIAKTAEGSFYNLAGNSVYIMNNSGGEAQLSYIIIYF